ncbi:MAG: hypothetical protein ACFB0C_19670 [Leptolyngbyaceae cyanobacterium]
MASTSKEMRARIDQGIAWYDKHRAVLLAAMPLYWRPVTYHPKALDRLDKWIGYWQRSELPLGLAEIYLLERFEALYRALKEKQK